jgi:hypothetical protein
MRHQILLVMFLVFGLIGMIRDNGYASADDLFFMHVNVLNDGARDLEDLHVRLVIYDLGIVLQSGSFDLNDGDTDGKLVFWDVPSDVKPGEYLTRVTVSNDDVRQVQHRLITVI